VGSAGIDYLVEDLPEKGIELHETLPHKSAILQAFAEPDFDILHITCHGKADPGSYDQARIILSDRRAGGKKVPVELDTTQVAAKARLDQDGSPRIVVLNACETGRQAPVLTDWGGWPRTFWDGGAAVFIGTSWAVDQSAAAAFTEGFYDALLQGQTLANASVTAREEARKATGDSSWLAYVVYGNPVARLPHED
jgi:CHAT domain-containing protein